MESPRAQTAAWWVWIIGQAVIVAFYAGRVKLSGGYPEPVEATADLGLAIGQLILGVLLAPALLHNVASVCRAALPALVMAALAGRLAGRTVGETALASMLVLLWLSAAGVWSRWAVARLGFAFLAIGLPVLFYASLEYQSPSTSLHNWPWIVSPVLGVCSTRLHSGHWQPLFCVGGVLLSGLAARRGIRPASPLYCNTGNND